jgi:hypothetical protein
MTTTKKKLRQDIEPLKVKAAKGARLRMDHASVGLLIAHRMAGRTDVGLSSLQLTRSKLCN